VQGRAERALTNLALQLEPQTTHYFFITYAIGRRAATETVTNKAASLGSVGIAAADRAQSQFTSTRTPTDLV